MAIPVIVGAAIELAVQVFKFINLKEKKKYSSKLYRLRDKLNEELLLPISEQNDAKVERLESEIKTIQDLAIAELRALNDK